MAIILKKSIEEGRQRALNLGKKGVLVLSGKQCSLGVSIDYCDIVILLNSSKSFDNVYQMMFRGMTEGENKRCGFVFDLDTNRAINNTIINIIDNNNKYKNMHYKESIKLLLESCLIHFNADCYISSAGDINNKLLNNLSNKIYDIYLNNTEYTLKSLLDKLQFKNIDLYINKEDQIKFNKLFLIKKTNSKTKK